MSTKDSPKVDNESTNIRTETSPIFPRVDRALMMLKSAFEDSETKQVFELATHAEIDAVLQVIRTGNKETDIQTKLLKLGENCIFAVCAIQGKAATHIHKEMENGKNLNVFWRMVDNENAPA